jgi:hypothetical protein
MSKSHLISVRQHTAGFLEARPRPGTGRHGEILADFLQSDVQADLSSARAFLDEITAVERGEKSQPSGVGNAFSIAIGPRGAAIRNAVLQGATPEIYDLLELRAALESWIELIERARFSGDASISPRQERDQNHCRGARVDSPDTAAAGKTAPDCPR